MDLLIYLSNHFPNCNSFYSYVCKRRGEEMFPGNGWLVMHVEQLLINWNTMWEGVTFQLLVIQGNVGSRYLERSLLTGRTSQTDNEEASD